MSLIDTLFVCSLHLDFPPRYVVCLLRTFRCPSSIRCLFARFISDSFLEKYQTSNLSSSFVQICYFVLLKSSDKLLHYFLSGPVKNQLKIAKLAPPLYTIA